MRVGWQYPMLVRALKSMGMIALVAGLAATGCGDGGPLDGNDDSEQTPRHLRYIQADDYSKLAMEVDYVPDYGPRSGVMSELEEDFTGLLDKPDGIEISKDGELESKGSEHEWTIDELDALADETSDMQVGEETAKIHVLFVDGGYEDDSDDSSILGLAWRHKNIAIFKENLEEACEGSGPLGGGPFNEQICAKAEKTVWTHEVGHVVGLVNNGLEMVEGHQDEEHGKHCDNDECVMYWKQRTSQVFDVLRDRFDNDNKSALGFDQSCRDDIKKVRDN